MLVKLIVALAVMCCLYSCQPKNKSPYLYQRLSSSETGIDFINTITNTKDFNIFIYRNFYNGGGVGIADINNDSLPDIYLTSNMGQNKLYLNLGDFKFKDITEQSGTSLNEKWSTGVTFVDINHDQFMDIYVSNAGFLKGGDQRNSLFINNGDLTFTDHAADFGLDDSGYSTHAAFLDYDKDGDLDVYILNNSFIPVNTLNFENKRLLRAADWPVKDFLKGGGDKLMRNDNGHFVDVTENAGLYSSLIGFGLGVTVGDVNNDLWPDLYISNDFFERDYLYINNQKGGFNESIKDYIDHISQFSMGADMADLNNDGRSDIFVTDMLPNDEYRLKTTSTFERYNIHDIKLKRDFYYQFMQNSLQINNGDSSFSELAHFSGVAGTDWSWGALLMDIDNDGFRDIFVSNGIYKDVTNQDFIDFFANEVIQKMALYSQIETIDSIINRMPSNPIPNALFKNLGGLKFEEIGHSSGMDDPSFSNGAAYADLDLDGDLDLVVNNVNEPCFIFKNNADLITNHQYIKIRLKQLGRNIDAIGAKIILFTSLGKQTTEVMPTHGFQSSVELTQHFGLGDGARIDSVRVFWPDGQLSTYFNLDANKYHLLDKQESSARTVVINKNKSSSAFFKKINTPFLPHTEDTFVDFYAEGLTFKKSSKAGPTLSVKDVNNNQLEDIFIGGAHGQTAQLYLQHPSGFRLTNQPSFLADQDFEDTASAFADIDGDGDQDLIVGSGGNHRPLGSPIFQDRVYVNDGSGNFTTSQYPLPQNGVNTSKILTMDYDKDGDIDLICFSDGVPGIYGLNSRNYIYNNDGQGRFVDVTQEVAPDFTKNGLVTDAVVVNEGPSQTPYLYIVGEWMGIEKYTYQQGKFETVHHKLNDLHGLWSSIAAADLDLDGRTDLICGNIGLNSYLSDQSKLPLKLWIHDFDQNGTIEKVLTRRIGNKDMPIFMKKELTEQIVSLKKENLKHADYATKGIKELIAPNILNKALVKTVNTVPSIVAYQNEDGTYLVRPLPDITQWSNVNTILTEDINRDQLPDVILGSNNYDFLPQFARLDANKPIILINNGNQSFDTWTNDITGIEADGMTKKIISIEYSNKKCYLFGINNSTPELYCPN